MPIRVNCPKCDASYTLGDDKRGKKLRCKECEEVISVPDAKPKTKLAPAAAEEKSKPDARPKTKIAAADREAKPKKKEEAAIQEGRKIKAAPPRKRSDDDDDDDDDRDERPAKNKKKKELAKKGGGGTMLVIGGVAAVLVFCLVGVGGGGAYWLLSKSDNGGNKIAKADVNQGGANPNADAGQGDKPADNPVRDGGKKDNAPPPTPIPVDPDAGKPLPQTLPPDLVAKVKKATVYLHVTMPSGVTASGSGFFAIERGIIVTNAHVLGMLAASSKAPKQVDVVQDSGLPTETKMVGEVLGVDRDSDLAVVRVPNNPKLPDPLMLAGEAPIELQKVYIFGFPFGEQLGKNITITEKAITSFRPNASGELDRIQIDGGMNPGNSGGPVVNTRGKLIGVSVSIITGAQISFAVPAEKVRQVMEGRVAEHKHGEAYRLQGQAKMPVRLKCLDPLSKIRDLRVEVWTGPPGAARPTSLQKPQPQPGDGPRQEHTLSYANGAASLDVPLPQLPAGHVYWVQPVINSARGTQWGQAQPTAPDLAILERKPANLTIDLVKQKERTTKLNNKLTVLEVIGKTQLSDIVTTSTETLEVLQEPVMKDGKKTAMIRTAYGPVSFDVAQDGKKVKFQKNELDAMAVVRGMPPSFVIDDTNSVVTFITVSLTPQSKFYHLADMVQGMNNFVQNPYEATQFKMPNRTVQPGETFQSQSTMARRSRSQQQQIGPVGPPKKGGIKMPPAAPKVEMIDLKMNLTYEGVRTRNNREEAILTVAGTLESRAPKGRVMGDITGKIGFDTAGGFISMAKINIFFEEELNIQGLGSLRISESRDIELDRAAGNLRNLVLKENPPPSKDPGPGPGLGAGGATKIVGGAFDPQFTDKAPDGSLLVGFDIGLGKFGANDTIAAIRPIYRNANGQEAPGKAYGKNFTRSFSIKAKPGYAIGGLTVNAGLAIDGFIITFMKINGERLNPNDSYQSPPIGGKGGGKSILGGDGTPVVGIVGKTNANDCTGIGLLLKQAGGGAGPVGGGDGGQIAAGGAVNNPNPTLFFNGDLSLRYLGFQKMTKTVGDLVWSRDGKSFYLLTDNGVIQQVNVATGQTAQFAELGRAGSNLAISGAGLLVAMPDELWILDPDKLADVRKKIPVPGIRRVSAGANASLAYAGPDKGNAPLQVVDLEEGAVVKAHNKVPIFLFRASPDGKYVFSVNGAEQLQRFRADGHDLILEDTSYRISSNGQNICFSPDSRFVALGTGGGNSKGHPDHPAVGNYSTFIYPIGNIKKPITGFASGGYPRQLGIDPKGGYIYGQNSDKPLLVYGFRAGDKQLGAFNFPGKGRVDVLEFSVSPAGGEALIRLDKAIVHLKVNKAGDPPLGWAIPALANDLQLAAEWNDRPRRERFDLPAWRDAFLR